MKKPIKKLAKPKRSRPRLSVMDTIRTHPRVAYVMDERDIGNGVLVELKQGFTFEEGVDNRVIGEDTASELLRTIRRSEPFEGPYTP